LILLALLALPMASASWGLNQPNIANTRLIGAKVENVTLDQSGRQATVTIRNLSDKEITAFDLTVQMKPTNKAPDLSDVSYNLKDFLPGMVSGMVQGILPGEAFDEVISVRSRNVVIDLDLVVFSDASVESANQDALAQVVAQRKAILDANNQVKDIIRNASSKEEAIDKLTRLWEESRETHPSMTHSLENHLYNLRNQKANSQAEEQQKMMDYANNTEKDGRFVALHCDLHRRAQ